jgi:predicted nucleotidyltransferase
MSALTAADLFATSLNVVTRSVILHGSLAAGGFRAGHSDIDLLVIVDGGLTDDQMASVEHLARQADLGDAAGLDLHLVTAEVAAAPTREPALELQIGRSTGAVEIARRVPADPDLPTELSMARADGRALHGAAPRDVIAPIPAEWIVERGRFWLRTWQSLTGDTAHAAFMVLTACRIWRFAAENVYCAKEQAGEWALRRDPSLSAVQEALFQYGHSKAAVIDERAIAHLLDTVLQKTAPGC